ncbi:HYR domain-containing protein [Methanophagales archaeon]|nr:HYR domain-containing protein [Methanophagales archaeon]
MVLNRGIGLIVVVVIAFMCANVGIDSVGAFGPPEIRILSPEEGVIYPSEEIKLEVAANESLVNWSYRLNGADPISFDPNTVTISVQEGTNTLSVAADWLGVTDSSDISFMVDTKPPEISCPADVTVEQATRNGTAVFLNVTASDLCDPNPVVTSNELAVYPLGTTTVTFIATDASGKSANCSVNVSVVDTTPPAISYPANVTVEQATRNGTAVFLNGTISDISDPNPNVTSNELAIYPPGTTSVTIIATDASGNSANCSVNVTVGDKKPPVITCPADLIVEQKTKGGAAVDLNVTVIDFCDPNPEVTSNKRDIYPPGTTTVTFTATDASGNSDSCSVDVTVGDTTSPMITCPRDVIVEQATVEGTAVDLDVNVTDFCDPNPEVTSNELDIYPPGTTTVTFTATDSSGNSASCSVTVTVVDTKPPEILCPADLRIEQDASGITIVPLNVTAYDTCDPNPNVTSNAPDTYPIGTTNVTFTATDASGNSASCSVSVTVFDITPPEVTIISPVDRVTYDSTSVDLIYTVNEPTKWVGYSLDGSGIITISGDIILEKLKNGPHNVTVFAEDLSGNNGSSTVSFGVFAVAPTITDIILSPTYALPGDTINLSVDAFDFSGVRWVRASVTKGGEDIWPIWLTRNETDEDLYTGKWLIMIFEEGGIYNITIEATDTEGNVAKSSPQEVVIPIDSEGPNATDIIVSPTSAKPGDKINVSANVTDDISGVRRVRGILTREGGDPMTVFMSDPEKDGIYTGTWSTMIFTEGGIYNLDIVTGDNNGNEAVVKAPSIEIIPIPVDTEVPSVTNMVISPTRADSGTPIELSAKVTDALSGVRDVKAIISKGGETISTVFLLDREEEGLYTGTWRTMVFTDGGIYNIDIIATDENGNVASVKAPDVEVVGDQEGPAILAVKVDPNNVPPGTQVGITAYADDSSGIRDVKAVVKKGGIHVITIYMPPDAEAGGGAFMGIWHTLVYEKAATYSVDIVATDIRGNEFLSADAVEIVIIS